MSRQASDKLSIHAHDRHVICLLFDMLIMQVACSLTDALLSP